MHKNKHYIVLMRRDGVRDSDAYILGSYPCEKSAKRAGRIERKCRSERYEFEISKHHVL